MEAALIALRAWRLHLDSQTGHAARKREKGARTAPLPSLRNTECAASISRLLASVSRLLASVSRMLASVSRLLASVSRLLASVSRLLASVNRLLAQSGVACSPSC